MSKKLVKILALPDLHGRKPILLFEQKPEFDIIITPGDICSDNLRNISSIKSLKEAKKESIEKGEEILKFLSSFNKPIYLVPGNWDPTQFTDGVQREIKNEWKKLISKFDLVHDCEYEAITLENFNIAIIGTGSTSAPELLSKTELNLRIKYEEDGEEIEELKQRYAFQKRKFEIIDELMQKYEDNFRILISHNSPYNTPLDIIQNPFNPLHNQHYGSTLTRFIIEKNQPELVISGHIHEGVGICKINNTVCLNTGFGDSIYHIITIDTESKRVVSIKKFGRNSV